MKEEIKQHDMRDCGAACLASIAAHYHYGISIARVRQYASTDKYGTNVLGLIRAAEKLGFEAKGVRGNVDALKAEAAKLPGDQEAVDKAGKKVAEDIIAKVPGKLYGNAKGQGYNYKSEPEANTVYGTTGDGKKMTGVKLEVRDNDNLGIAYKAHVANVGWMDWVKDGDEAGQGDNAIEAVRIKLTGADADKYDVFYRAHVANIGWMQWTKNDEMAGTQGLGYAIEAIEAYVAPKGATYNHNEYNYQKASVVPERGSGQAHIQNIGDGQGFVPFNQVQKATIGTTGQSLRLEGITFKDQDPDLNLTYRAHCQNPFSAIFEAATRNTASPLVISTLVVTIFALFI